MNNFKFSLILLLCCTFFFWGIEPISAQQTSPADLSLGSIDFPTGVKGKAQQEFLTGVLALHSFWYPEARTHFRKAQEFNPNFAMAYWGEAMTYDHPIWEQHDQQAGTNVLERLDNQIENGNVQWSDRGKEYIEALRTLFDDELTMDQRRKHYAKAMQELSETYPDDDEALAFAALASMTVPNYDYSDPDVRDLVPIASKLEELYQRNPDHPGAMHYLIHIYDNEKFAEMGLRPARDYAKIAYSSSHAIHMPSHIYKHMEMWDKVIESNIRAYKASIEWQKETNRSLKDRDYHSYRWLFEAYLEIENYEKACKKITELRRIISQAKENGEELSRMPGVLENLENQYKNKSGSKAPQCKSDR